MPAEPPGHGLPLDQAAFERLDAFIKSHAQRLAPVGATIEASDLRQCGWVAAIEAAARFDPARGTPFEAFVRPRVRGAMVDEVRRILRQVPSMPLDPVTVEHAGPVAEPRWDAIVRNLDIACAISRLDVRDRTMLRDIYAGSRTPAAIAKASGQPHGRVRRQHWDALRCLREDLELRPWCTPARDA